MSNAKLRHRDSFRPKLIALSVAACFSVSATQSLANPTGPTVTSGNASFATSGNTLTITNTANTIINWQTFSIGVNEITRFLQSSGSSVVLNRVTGSNGVIPQSVIDGILTSNGRILLLNPSGVVIGSTGRIDVAGFVASSLSLSDQDFKSGRMRFTATPGAGAVTNAGVIDTTSGGPGGRVFLIGPDVQNSGVIRSPQGEIVLAAGKTVELVSENLPFVTVTITADNERALNVGKLIADSGRIGMFGALVRQGGVVEANSAVVGANGEIRLVATKDLTLDEGSVTSANGPSGGKILLQAQGGTNLVYGTVEAKGDSGQGGTIEALGVRVGVLGHGVIDASGDTGGGTVLVGGDAHGANPNIQNAEQVLIGPDGVIRADAGTTGDGGRVIVWSDIETRVFGSISARGGSQSGNGGFVETSSKGGLDVNYAKVDTRAPKGQWGTWLLDPTDVILEPNSYGAGDPLAYAATFTTNPGTTAHITEQTVETGFATNGTVKIQASNDVNFKTDLTLVYSGPTTGLFEVRAVHNIDMAYGGTGPHTIISNGNVVLSANDVDGAAAGGLPALNTASGTGSIIGGGNIRTDYGGVPGGDISLSGYGVNVGNLETMGGVNRVQVGNITIVALGGGVTTGTITTRGADGKDFNGGQAAPATAGGNGGAINITAGYGSVSTGAIDTSGGRGGNGGYATGQVFDGAAGGNAGTVTIGTSTYGPVISINTGSIKSTGGIGGFGGSGAVVTLNANTLNIGYGGTGGNGGVVSLSAGSVTTAAIDTSGAAGGAGGSNINATLNSGPDINFAGNGSLTVGRGGDGGFGAQVSINSNSITTGSITTAGGAGGAGGSGNTGVSIVNAATAPILIGFGSANVGSGGSGGSGGQVSFNAMGPINIGGPIITVGGAGGAGGANSKANSAMYGFAIASSISSDAFAGLGGRGGSGGQVNLGGSVVTTGAITTSSGAGGTGGSNSNAQAYASSFVAGSSFSASANAGSGGDGGFSAGDVTIFAGNTLGNGVSTGAITATGTVGGAGGAGSSAFASGYGASPQIEITAAYAGFGGFGGSVALNGYGGVSVGGSIDVSGFGPGFVDVITTTGNITTGPVSARSFDPTTPGGDVTFTTDTGRITVNGTIDVRGADGLGVAFDTCHDGCIGFFYGGSAGGTVSMTRTGQGDPVGGVAFQINGDILASGGNGFSPQGAAGGNGGAGGGVGFVSVYGGGTFYGAVNVAGGIDVHGGNGGNAAAGFSGGSGGLGGVVSLAGVSVSSGSINAAGGAGGAGGAYGANGAGAGGAGGAGGNVQLAGITSVTAGSIFAAGGSGGNGGSTTVAGTTGGRGGDGGVGGLVSISTNFAPSTSVTVGNIDISGGRGGNGGDAPAGFGGAGGIGGGTLDVIIDPDNGNIGSIAASGGAGGSGGYGGIQGGAAGQGGAGALIEIFGIGYGGSLAVGNIDASGGAGGNGGGSGGANVYGAAGAAGGLGGSVIISGGGIIDLTKGGTITATGGAGGAGGAGVGAYGGNGGNGGVGGLVDLFTQSANGYGGQIFVLSPLQVPNVNVAGGVGGAGGATGGLSGTTGVLGSFTQQGTIVVITPGSNSLDVNTVIQGTNQSTTTNTIVASAESAEKKEKESKQKQQAAACK